MKGMKGLSSHKLPFSKKSLPKRVIFSYILDYVIIVALIALFYVIDHVNGFHQHFSLQNYTLQYPFATQERIPVSALLFIVVVAPAGIIAVYTLVVDGLFSHVAPTVAVTGKRRLLSGRYRMKDRLWELNCGLLGLMLSVGAAFVVTGTLKNAIGKPRPDLIDRCRPPAGTVDPPMFGLSNSSICTQTNNKILQDGFRSFPSGHSSTAFAGLFYLSIYLAGKLHVLDSKGEVWKTLLVLIPTLAAALVAGSRIMDARHHPFDVISGSMLGMLVAWGSYRQYFPPVTESWRKGRAYPIRSWGKEPEAPSHVADPDSVPLTASLKLADEERRGSDEHSTGFEAQSHGDNVFRAQVAASQRQRSLKEQAYPATGSPTNFEVPRRFETTSSTYSQNLGPSRNPFAEHEVQPPLPPRGRAEHYNESSSEDEAGYELQTTYTLSNPQKGGGIAPGPYDEDTGYVGVQQLKDIPGARPELPVRRVDSNSEDLGVVRR